jgi:opacity protein-like surface antigen
MKYIKNVTILLFVAGFSFTQAQTEKGKVLIGGDSKLQITSAKSTRYSDIGKSEGGNQKLIELSPQIAYLIKDYFALGLQVQYANLVSSEISTLIAMPFVRFYLGNTSTGVIPFVQGGIGPGYTKSDIYTYDVSGELLIKESIKASIVSYKLNMGIAAFVSKSISFEMGISYQQTSSKLTKYNPLNTKEIIDVFGFSVGLGILL